MRLRLTLLALSLGGCVAITSARVVEQGGSAEGRGEFAGEGSGSVWIMLGSKKFTGTWVVVQDGSLSLGLFAASGSGGNARGVGIGASTALQAPGLARLSASDGATLRCEFMYSAVSNAGAGVCIDGFDTKFDLLLKFEGYHSSGSISAPPVP